MQQDPIREGMNWYAYVGNNPVTRVDPSGLYWDWIHKNDTRNAAKAVGFSDYAAGLMAQAAWDVDQGGYISKLGPAHNFDPLVGAADFALDQLRKAAGLWRSGHREEAYRELGYGAHAVQDSYAHSGISPADHMTLDNDPNTDPDRPCNDLAKYFQSQDALEAYMLSFSRLINAP